MIYKMVDGHGIGFKSLIKDKLKKWLVIGLRILLLNGNIQLMVATRIRKGYLIIYLLQWQRKQ